MTFSDIFKNSFLNGYQVQNITTEYVLITLVLTALIAAYIFMVYRLTCSKVFYSLNFNISLIGVALITATIIFTIQSSIVISLGMVGALSIIRFRTAIKDPLDLVFLFWAISVGIICGAGFAQFAVILSILLTIVLVVMSKAREIKRGQLVVINGTSDIKEIDVLNCLKSESKKLKVKSQKLSGNMFTMVVEAYLPEDTTIIRKIMDVNGVTSVSVMTHDGEFTY